MKQITIILSFLFYLHTTTYAQSNVTGTIYKSDGKPSKGVEVEVGRLKAKVKTQKDGKFLFENVLASDSLTIKVSKTKYLSLAVADYSDLRIILDKKQAVVERGDKKENVPYIEKKSSKKNGNIITHEDIEKYGFRTFTDAVRTISGVNILNGTIQIRGANSFSGSTEPLYMLDNSQTTYEYLEALDIFDIKSIEVNKTGSGYGSRGANGVIIVKTK